jgi:hypothetical protein
MLGAGTTLRVTRNWLGMEFEVISRLEPTDLLTFAEVTDPLTVDRSPVFINVGH